MQIGILGPLVVSDGGRDLPVSGSRLRRLLTRFAVDADRTVPSAELVEAVWPDDPPQDVANSLQSLVSRLRRALGDPRLIQQLPTGYRLDLAPGAIDAGVFTELATTGRAALRSGNPRAARDTLMTGLRLWRGAPLVDADDAAYTIAPAARWDELRLTALGDMIDAELQLGNGAAMVVNLEMLVEDHPLREQFVGQLMKALAASGRTADALTAYQALRDRLADLLGADPGPEVQAVHLALLRGDGEPDAHQGTPVRRTNLRTAVSSFVGREAELARVAMLVQAGRLTTIVGPGGAGKTRLAVQAAAPWVDRCRGGVWLVELAPVTDEATIAGAVLSALGLRDARILERRSDWSSGIGATERVFETLADSDALLVIDNCEHLIAGVAELVAEILARCPQVRVLATSREPLGIAGEALCSIPPLGLPPENATPEQAAGYPAVALLVARGSAASAEFTLDAQTVGPVIDIVRRLDGLPLAIELAAARLRVLPVSEISARLGDRFRLLAGGLRTSVARHRTLRAVVEWSWDLLTDREKLLAERLSVFPAGATVDAATEICSDAAIPAAEVADLLLALVDKSLLQIVHDRTVRYRMLETIREYGVERLDERGELAAARTAHSDYFEALTHRLSPVLRTAEQLDALAELTDERDNILAALRYLGDSGYPERVLELVLDLGWFWNITGSHTETLIWTEFALQASEGIESPSRTKAEAGRMLAAMATSAGRPDEEWTGVEEAMRETGRRLRLIDDGTDPMTLVVRLVVAFFGEDDEEIETLLATGRASADPWIRAVTGSTHVMLLENLGDVAGMRREVEDAYDAFTEIGDRWGLAQVLTARANILSQDGDLDGAVCDYLQALQYLTELGTTEDDMQVHLRLATLRLRQGNFPAARAEVVLVRTGAAGQPPTTERSLLADIATAAIALAQGALDEARTVAADLRVRTYQGSRQNPLFGHVLALVGGACAMVAVRTGDLPTAADDLLRAYVAAVTTHDRPILAGVGVSIAAFAEATGRPRDAAEMLGAAARLRGSDDPDDLNIARLRASLQAALGVEDYRSAYAVGRALPAEQATTRIDPAPLIAGMR